MESISMVEAINRALKGDIQAQDAIIKWCKKDMEDQKEIRKLLRQALREVK